MSYKINYSNERVLPQDLVGKALAGQTVYESSCTVDVDGVLDPELNFSVRYQGETTEEAEANRSVAAQAQLKLMVERKGVKDTPAHPTMKKFETVEKASLEVVKSVEAPR